MTSRSSFTTSRLSSFFLLSYSISESLSLMAFLRSLICFFSSFLSFLRCSFFLFFSCSDFSSSAANFSRVAFSLYNFSNWPFNCSICRSPAFLAPDSCSTASSSLRFSANNAVVCFCKSVLSTDNYAASTSLP